MDIANIVDDGKTHIAAAQKKEMPSNNLVKENLDLKSLAMHPSAKKLHFRPKMKKKIKCAQIKNVCTSTGKKVKINFFLSLICRGIRRSIN